MTDVVWDLAPHDLSIILDLMNEPPEEVETQGGWFTQDNLAEAAFLTLRFSRQRLAHIHVSWLTPNKTRLLQIVGQRRVVVYDDMQTVQKVQVYDTGVDNRTAYEEQDSHQLSYGPGNIWIPSVPTTEPLRAECQDFVRAICEGDSPYSSGQRAVEVVRVLEKASEHVRNQSPVRSVHAE
jgi:predicted dehydrogenase